MQFRLQIQRQEFGPLRFHNRHILSGDHILKLLCLFIRSILVIFRDVRPGDRREFCYRRDRKIHSEFRTARLLHNFLITKKPNKGYLEIIYLAETFKFELI